MIQFQNGVILTNSKSCDLGILGLGCQQSWNSGLAEMAGFLGSGVP